MFLIEPKEAYFTAELRDFKMGNIAPKIVNDFDMNSDVEGVVYFLHLFKNIISEIGTKNRNPLSED